MRAYAYGAQGRAGGTLPVRDPPAPEAAGAPMKAAPAEAVAEVRAHVRALSERLNGLDVREFETRSSEALASGLLPSCTSLLEEVAESLEGIVDRLAPGRPESGGFRPEELPGEAEAAFEKRLDAAVDTRRLPCDVAFIAALELRQRSGRLAHLGHGQPPLVLIGACDGALRAIRKALAAVDAVIAETTGSAPQLDFSSVLQSSLRVRRRYATFRQRILAVGEPGAEGLHARLRALGTHIAKLVGWDVYPELRAHDRRQIRDLQARILGWLQAGEAASTADGVRLWQDLVASVRLMAQMSRRQELVEHDRGVVERASAALARIPGDGEVPEPILRLLGSLEGMDEALDDLLQRGERRASRWRTVLAPALERLGHPGPGGAR